MSIELTNGDFGYNVVAKHNDLVLASHDLNVTEYKLLLGCISKVNSFEKIDSETAFEFNLEEAAEIFNFDYKNSGVVKMFRDAAHNLMRKIVVSDIDGFDDTVIAYRARYDTRTRTMAIYFSPGIIPYISGLRSNLTTYRILHIGKMKSKHAIRLYELLIMWLSKKYEHTKIKELELDEFKKMLGIQNDYADSFSMFNKKVIHPILEQINEFTDIHLEIKLSKTGKKYSHIELTFHYKEEWIDFESTIRNNKKLTKEQVKKITNSKGFFEKYYKKYPGLGIGEWIDKVTEQLNENPYAYFPDYTVYLNS